VDAALLNRWHEAKAILNAAKEQEDAAKAALLTALGDAEAGECEAGVVTYLEQERRSVDLLALREKHPDVASECERVSAFRVLRFKKPKAAK
jgi:hypothetical protein